MPAVVWANEPVDRCADMRLDEAVAPRIGYALTQLKAEGTAIPDSRVSMQPRLAGLRGPNVTFIGRSVRQAVMRGQASPQELWQGARWNNADIKCSHATYALPFTQRFMWKTTFENSLGLTTYYPRVLARSRLLVAGLMTQPFGFTVGASAAIPLYTNTETLMHIADPRPPVRRDIDDFDNGISAENLFLSWHATPLTDLHIGITGGLLEGMYGGYGAEFVYRPYGSPFWVGGDGWKVWRRDPDSTAAMKLTDGSRFTGQVRVGYDMPDTRFSTSLAAGRYLGGDKGATLKLSQGFGEASRIEASVTWSGREEVIGFTHNAHFAPIFRIVVPLGTMGGGHHSIDTSIRQVGRDSGQALERPTPIESMTEVFSAREIARHWPDLF
ncbi:MAG: YjbH domain-containing protein [Alphaproteobacteria bacterium]|nr:YjbH domain-containing protein [Alphaproteobacteria bacterium]